MDKSQQARVLSQLRVEHVGSQAKLAQALKDATGRDVHIQQISAWESGRQGITVENFGRILQALGLSWSAVDSVLE